MMRIREYLLAMLGLAAALAFGEKCCEKKKVGDKSYTLVDIGVDVPPDCVNSCVYSQDDDPTQKVCFAPGNLSHTCSGSGCQGSNTDLKNIPEILCPARNVDCVGPHNVLVTLNDTMDYYECGRACQYYGRNCNFWTYSHYFARTCFLLSDCKNPKTSALSTSGDENCPPGISLPSVNEPPCKPCGSCPLCCGKCIFGSCVGLCPGLNYFNLFDGSNAGCKTECPIGGEEECQNCLEGKAPFATKFTPGFDCLSCVSHIVQIVYECYLENEPNYFAIFTCILSRVVPACKNCLCDILLQYFPELHRFCGDTSGYPEIDIYGNEINAAGIKDVISQITAGAVGKTGTKCGFGPSTGVKYQYFPFPTGGICYGFISANPLEWYDAQSKCREDGGLLAILDSNPKTIAAERLVADSGFSNGVWCGGRSADPSNLVPPPKSGWVWDNDNGTTIQFSSYENKEWCKGEPSKTLGEVFVEFNVPCDFRRGFNNLGEQQKPFLCQAQPTS